MGSYPPDDLAVIRVDDPSGLQPARFGDSAKAQAGDVVLAVGNPLGLSGSVTSGIISATGRVVAEPASDGTPGRHPAGRDPDQRADQPGQQRRRPGDDRRGGGRHPDADRGGRARRRPVQGIGFAIPSNLVRDIASSSSLGATSPTRTGPRSAPRWARSRGQDGSPAGTGIVAVTSGGPADRAGLRAGDVIRTAGGTSTPDTQALATALAAAHPGDKIALSVVRGTERLTVTATLGELPAS